MAREKRGVWREVLLVAVVAAGLGVAANHLVSLRRAADQAALRSQTLQAAATLRARIESELSATAFLAQGLVAYIRAQGPTDAAHLERAMAALFTSGRHLRNIGIAPANRVAYVYPLAGNESAIGLVYEESPGQWPAVQRAMQIRAAVLAGPVELVQGGRALINRAPVFMNGDDYWGMVSVVIDLDAFLREIGLPTPDTPEAPVRVALRGAGGDLIAGEAGVLDEAPLRMTLQIPGGTWELAAVPSGGWSGHDRYAGLLAYFAYGSVVVLSGLLWLMLRERARTRLARAELLEVNRTLEAANHELEKLSETDPLTGIPNRRGLDEVLTLEWRRARRHFHPLSLLMIDIDQFKSYNDAYGHAKGDECLKQVVAAMQATTTRAGEFLARSGGEEFVMVLPGSGEAEALAQAERVRAAVENAGIKHGHSGVSRYVTVSVGAATRKPHSSIALHALREAADSAMYEAKRGGRNCVRAAVLGDAQ